MIHRRTTLPAVAATAAAAAALAVLTAAPATAHGPAPDPAALAAHRVVELVNVHRAARGCPALEADPVLGAVATAHSGDMAARGRLTHVGSDGSSPARRVARAGYRARAWAENAAWGHTSPEDVVQAWIASPGHRANILNCRLREAGVGLAGDPAAPYWTMAFATPR